MKRILFLLLSMTLLLSMAACGNDPKGSEAPSQTSEPSSPADTADGNSTDDENGTVLVVYFSAQNHTKAVAQTIAEHMDADIFELIPVQPYTEDDLNWRDESSRVNAEHEDESQRDISLEADSVEDWEDYDTIFVGYPIWWGIAAWPVNNFIKSNDFTGKTVIPFCTSTSSGLGESSELLAEMAGSGDWQDGQRFSSGASADEVTEWLDSLEL